MGKFFSAILLFAVVISCALLPSCGSGSPTKIAPEVLPTGVGINPSGQVSLELGHTQAFSATPSADSFSFQSSNTAVVTIANNGQACAGTWNSLTSPTVCSPGQPGVSEITASTLGVTSTPVTVYVHAPITSVSISKVAGQPATLSTDCISKGPVHGPESWTFQANAFNGTTNITSSVGPFSWQQITPTGSSPIVSFSTPPNGTQSCVLSPSGQCLNEQTATASVPGIGQIYASTSGFSSQPISIETCRIQSISIAAAGDVPSDTSFQVNTGTSTILNATVTDIAGQAVTGVPLTWSSSNPASVGISGNNTSKIYGSVGSASSSSAGAGTVIASCTPPTCNAGLTVPQSTGFPLSLPIYPQAAINFSVQNTSTTAAASPTVYATTTACADQIANPSGATCNPTVVPISQASSTSSFAAGTPVALPFSPNSFVYDSKGSFAYLGVDSSDFSQHGLMVFSGSSPSTASVVPGKVLAISPDTTSVVISDTVDTPNQVFICTNCNGTSRTVTSFLINGATAAAFSPDNLKAYILAGSTLYVYSRVDPLETITLGAPGNDVVFAPEGGFAYVAESSNSAVPYRNCDNFELLGATVPTSSTPVAIRALPDGATLAALDPPNIDLFPVTMVPAFPLSPISCTATLNPTTATPFNLGQGNFTPSQFFISPSGTIAYILGGFNTAVSVTGATQSGSTTTYSYTLTSGPPLQVGQGIVITGMQDSADNGGFTIDTLQTGIFTVTNSTGANSAPSSAGATGTVSYHLPFVMTFNLATKSASQISLLNGAAPLSASLAPAGNFLFVGADDGTVHVIDTSSGTDIQQVSFPFPTNELCYGPGSSPTQVPLTQIRISAATQNGPANTTTYTYSLISGPALKTNQSITIADMGNGGNDGTFTITGVGTDASGNSIFTVTNSNGVTATGQSGLGTVPITCNPDFVVVKP